MRRFVFLIAALLVGLWMTGTAGAMICEESQALDAGDACYTRVRLSSGEQTIVSQGHVLVWDIDSNSPRQGSYSVRMPRTLSLGSGENAIVAGVAQATIATGDTGLVLVNGFGRLRTVGGVATGDTLYLAASGNAAAITVTTASGGTVAIASVDPIAIALETSSTNGTTARNAYIKIL